MLSFACLKSGTWVLKQDGQSHGMSQCQKISVMQAASNDTEVSLECHNRCSVVLLLSHHINGWTILLSRTELVNHHTRVSQSVVSVEIV
jgi:hypothetical protein